jgi:hypothetical protein
MTKVKIAQRVICDECLQELISCDNCSKVFDTEDEEIACVNGNHFCITCSE